MLNGTVPVILCTLAASWLRYLSCELFFCSYKFSYYFRREGNLFFFLNGVEGMFPIIKKKKNKNTTPLWKLSFQLPNLLGEYLLTEGKKCEFSGGLATNYYCLQTDSSLRRQASLMTAYAITIHDIVLTRMEQQPCFKPRRRRKKKSVSCA